MRPIRSIGLLALLSIAAATSGEAQIEARYSKTELRVPMRDGTHLFTVVYAPRDTSRRYPIMMTRTPYSVGPYGPNAYRQNGSLTALCRRGLHLRLSGCA